MDDSIHGLSACGRHIMKKSVYSGTFGDYSTFSDEMEEDAAKEEEAEREDEV